MTAEAEAEVVAVVVGEVEAEVADAAVEEVVEDADPAMMVTVVGFVNVDRHENFL